MNLNSLPAAWGLPEPWRLTPADNGTNNLTWYLQTPVGGYFLRVYQNTADPERIRYEHVLLTALEQRGGLSFAVPAPVPTLTGETLVPIAGGEAVAALFHRIPGETAIRGRLEHAAAGGEALGELDRALAEITPPPVESRPGPYGAIDRVHPLVPDAGEAMASLPLPPADRQALTRLVRELQKQVPSLYLRLPHQLIHADFCRPNILLEGDRVTGVLDFEFALPDLRIMDLAVSLYLFTNGFFGTDLEWPLIEAFGRGYARRCRLTPAEVEALPTALRLVRLGSLLHWTGRTRQGLAAEAELPDRAQSLLDLLAWLEKHQGRLLGSARRWHGIA